MSYDYDLLCVGGGSGGVRCARIAAGEYGARVAVAEADRLGGTCVNVGCVPKKLMRYAARLGEQVEDAGPLGWRFAAPRFDWGTLMGNVRREVERLGGVYRRLLETAGVEVLTGRARLLDPHTVEIAGRRHTAQHVVLATGSRPWVPDVPGARGLGATSDDFFAWDVQPRRVLVVGGGYIGVELAGILRGLGSRVTQIYRGALFLRGFDRDVREALAEAMGRRLDLRFGVNVQAVERVAGGLRVTLTEGAALEVDQVLFATGRRPNSAGLGLEAIGVGLDPRGAVEVDAISRSAVSGVWAIGDLTDRINLTPVALMEGQAVAETIFGGAPVRPDHQGVPTAVFSQPPVACVGLTEEEARARCEIDVYRSRFRPMRHTLTASPERAMMKLVVDRASDRVLGCHLVGPDACEIVQGFAVAMKCGATKAQLDATVGVHPSAAEELVTMRTKLSEDRSETSRQGAMSSTAGK